MHEDNDSSTLVVLDTEQCLILEAIDNDTSLTILALISDDPSTWEEALSVWPRYRSPSVCEYPSSLPLEERDAQTVVPLLSRTEAWIVIDFEKKRVTTGGLFPDFGRDATLAMTDDEDDDRGCSMSIHLPPWWEYYERAEAASVNQARISPIDKPLVNREILYGEPFLADISSRILRIVTSKAWRDCPLVDGQRDVCSFTIEVHRDWLMTPRADLDGRTPRQLLHGAIPWCDSVVWGQQLRCQDGEPLVAVPNDWKGFATAPMGSQEMCMYFDLCREIIETGWTWCQTHEESLATEPQESLRTQLVEFLRSSKEQWLKNPFEGGAPPSFIIECDRRRVPWGSGIPIEGIEVVPREQHVSDCDCPICAMMADGMFGVSFTSIDGHHLESDGEFAFSMHETREEWEEEQGVYDDFDDDLENDSDLDEDDTGEDDPEDADDGFASAWPGIKPDGPFPGDRGGYLKMAFMISDIGMALQDQGAEQEEVRQLNAAFADYRRSGAQCAESSAKLKDILQSLSDEYPELISKSADLQSRIDESVRALASNDQDPENPF
jgi:hypothetical protein